MCISLSFMCLISHLQEAESYPEKSCFPGEEYFQGRIEGQQVNVRTEGHSRIFKILCGWDRCISVQKMVYWVKEHRESLQKK